MKRGCIRTLMHPRSIILLVSGDRKSARISVEERFFIDQTLFGREEQPE